MFPCRWLFIRVTLCLVLISFTLICYYQFELHSYRNILPQSANESYSVSQEYTSEQDALHLTTRQFVKTSASSPRSIDHMTSHWARITSSETFLAGFNKSCSARYSSPDQCMCLPTGLVGKIQINQSEPSWEELHSSITVIPGGESRPAHCLPLQRVAIVIPYKDREVHLKVLLKHLHPLLSRQQVHYRIFIIEQVAPEVFNRAVLMNIGFVEAKRIFLPDCVFFHDVDLIPEDDRHMYLCQQTAVHHSASMSKYFYRLPFSKFFGGIVSAPVSVVEAINGWANRFYGWGGEDNDIRHRFLVSNQTTLQYRSPVAYYTMIRHSSDSTNPRNPYKLDGASIEKVKATQWEDGLTSLQYHTISTEVKPLYTHIKAVPVSALLNYTSRSSAVHCEHNVLMSQSCSLLDCAAQCNQLGALCLGFSYNFSVPIFYIRRHGGDPTTCYLYNDTCVHDIQTAHDIRFYDKDV